MYCIASTFHHLSSLLCHFATSTAAEGKHTLLGGTKKHTAPPTSLSPYRAQGRRMYEDIEIEETGMSKLHANIARKWQHYLDLSAPHTGPRWALSAAIILIYCIRVYLIEGAPSARAHC